MTIALVIPDISQGLAEQFMSSIRPFTENLILRPATYDERRIYCPAYLDSPAWTIWDDSDDEAGYNHFDGYDESYERNRHNDYLHYYWLMFWAGRTSWEGGAKPRGRDA